MDANTISVGTATFSVGTFFLALKLVFQAGKLIGKIEEIDHRVTRLEGAHGQGD